MFSDNDRITQNQLKRQVLLTLSGGFLLVQSGMQQFYGREGFLGILLCFPVLLLYLFLLVRVSAAYRNPERVLGTAGACLFMLPYYVFLALTGSYYLRYTGEMIQMYLVPGMRMEGLLLIVLAAAFLGTGRDLQRRARMAQVACPLVLGGFLIMVLAAAFSADPACLQQEGALEPMKILSGAEGFFSACLLISLVPFILNQVEQGARTFRTLSVSVGIMLLLLLAILSVLIGTFGYQGLMRQETPVLKLMSGVLLPGKFLERFDIVWMAVLLFSLLYLVGSILFYGERLCAQVHVRGGAWILILLIYGGAFFEYDGRDIRYYYGLLMRHFGIPILILLPLLMLFMKQKKFRVKQAMGVILALMLVGCGAVEPEKRAYPLCIAIDWKDEQYQVIYGIADLAQSTGQGKDQESDTEEKKMLHAFNGRTFADIEKSYQESQEYYLDLGHVQAVILGERLWNNEEKRTETLNYLEQQPLIGRTAGVFSCEDITEVMEINAALPDSLGEYLNGIYKNRPEKKEPVSLDTVFYSQYNGAEFPKLPEILIQENGIRLKALE